MAELIDDMLQLSRVTRADLSRRQVDISTLAREVAAELQRQDPERQVEFRIETGSSPMPTRGLMRIVLENLLGNAWKFTRGDREPERSSSARSTRDEPTYFVRDNGAGFDMTLRRQALPPVPAAAHGRRVSRHRHRPRDDPAGHRPARRPRLGGGRGRRGRDVLLHAAEGRRPPPSRRKRREPASAARSL